MVEIIVDNSYSQVVGLKTDKAKELKKALSYQINPQAAFYSGGWVKTKSLVDKFGDFPTGLLSKVQKIIGAHKLTDKRIIPEYHAQLPTIGTPELRSSQLSACKAAMTIPRGGIVMPTGSGKSLVIAKIASLRGLKTLVVVPNVSIRDQLADVLKNWQIFNVTVLNIDSTKLSKMTDFDCLIIDECHHVAANTYQKLNKTAWKGIYYRYFLSATYERNQANEQLLFEGIAGDVIYELNYEQAVNEGCIVPIEGYYYETIKQPCDLHTWASVYSALVVKNETRNEMIAVTLLRLIQAEKSTLVLVKELAHGHILSEMTGVPFCNGQDSDSREYLTEFNKGTIKGLIATTGVAGEGTDTKPCEFIIIAGLGKARTAFKQQVGRVVRTYPGKESGKVILFLDKSHKFTKAHFKAQKDVLEQDYKISLTKLEI